MFLSVARLVFPALAAICLSLLLHAPAAAIMSGDESTKARSGDSDYADGKDFLDAEDYAAAIEAFDKVVERRPWHDNAHTYLGFSHRQLGDYDTALEHYAIALELNPRNRGALEYLGATYLELGRVEDANAIALRLGEVCNYVVMAFDNQGWKSGCEELDQLTERYRTMGVPLPEPKQPPS